MVPKNILVTGGAGFIGSHVTKQLQKEGYQPIVLDNLSRGDIRTLKEVPFIQGDIGDERALQAVFQTYPIDAVMHFAALIDVGESVISPELYYLNNVCHTLTLIRTMLQHQVRKLIFSSSAAIFGLPQTPFIDEDHPCAPINPYGHSKWMIEKMLHDFDRAHQLKFCCLRYFNAAGGDPEGQIKMFQKRPTNLIPLVVRSVKTGEPLTIFGTDYPTHDGTCIRDYIHIEDLGTAHLLSLRRIFEKDASCYYNLGNGEGYSVRQVIEAAEKVTGLKVFFREGARRAGDPPVLVAHAKKAERELKWQPRYPELEMMIAHAWEALNCK